MGFHGILPGQIIPLRVILVLRASLELDSSPEDMVSIMRRDIGCWADSARELCLWILVVDGHTRPGKRLQKKNEGKIHHAINGKTHVFSTGPFSIVMLVYQRVTPCKYSNYSYVMLYCVCINIYI